MEETSKYKEFRFNDDPLSIEAYLNKENLPLVCPEELLTWIIYEDENIIAINKPGWLPCHKSKGGPLSSLTGAIRASKMFPQEGKVFLVHRLDRETSGINIIAKTKEVSATLQKSIREGEVKKIYKAIVKGELNSVLEVSADLAIDNTTELKSIRMCALTPQESAEKITERLSKGKWEKKTFWSAITKFTPLAIGNKYTLCAVELLESGRKHQIRIHAACVDHPIIGDKLYPSDQPYIYFVQNGLGNMLFDGTLEAPRHLLHCSRMIFHIEEKEYDLHCDLPMDMCSFIDINIT